MRVVKCYSLCLVTTGKAEVWAESGVQGAESHCLLLPPHQQFYEQASASTAALVAIR